MTKKIALIMGVLIVLFLAVQTYINSMINIQMDSIVSGVYFRWKYIINLSMNEWIPFSIGLVLVLGGLKHKILAMRIVSYLLLVSIIVLFVSGLYFGLTKTHYQINLYRDTFYLAYVVILVAFSVVSVALHTVTKKIHLSLLVLLNITVIAVYFEQSLEFGGIFDSLSYNLVEILYRILSYLIIYPSTILIYILFTIMYIREKGNKDVSAEEKNPSKLYNDEEKRSVNMTKKIALIMGAIIVIFLALYAYTNSMIEIMGRDSIGAYGVYLQWSYIIYFSMNEWIAFSIGLVLVIGGLKHKVLAMRIVSYLLLVSIIVLFVSGLYFGLTKKPVLFDFYRYVNLYRDTFYLAYVGILVVFSVVSVVLHSIPKKIHLSLLVLLNITVIAVYFKQSLNNGWLYDRLSYNMASTIYPILSDLIIYPSIILIYVLYTVIYIREKGNRDLYIGEKNPSKL